MLSMYLPTNSHAKLNMGLEEPKAGGYQMGRDMREIGLRNAI